MTAEKMANILNWLSFCGVKLRGAWIGVSAGAELVIDPGGQLPYNLHRWMLNRGFVYIDDRYNYRPIVRRKKA